MIQFKPLDAKVPIDQQLQLGGNGNEPVVLFNLFTVAEEDIPAVIAAWTADATWLKKQPGYISTQLHRGISGSNVFFNYAVWENIDAFRTAFNHPDFKSTLKDYPDSAVSSPHLFKRITIPNLCVGP